MNHHQYRRGIRPANQVTVGSPTEIVGSKSPPSPPPPGTAVQGPYHRHELSNVVGGRQITSCVIGRSLARIRVDLPGGAGLERPDQHGLLGQRSPGPESAYVHQRRGGGLRTTAAAHLSSSQTSTLFRSSTSSRPSQRGVRPEQ